MPSYQHITVTELTPSIGAEVTGVDLAALTNDELQEIKAAFLDRLVLVFRDQQLEQDDHKRFGRSFGELHVHPSISHLGMAGDPELFVINTTPQSRFSNGEAWHSDVSCDPIPPMASLLYVKQTPAGGGGDTLFSNMYDAYAALSAPLQALLKPLVAFHDGRRDLADYGYQLPPEKNYPNAYHPVIIAHPETGRPALFVNNSFTCHIDTIPKSESDTLLHLLYEHANNPRWQCRVQWTANTLTMWDNRCAQHHAVWDYYPERRYAERVTVAGTSAPAAYQ